MAVHHLVLLQIILSLSIVKASEKCPSACGAIRMLYPFGIGAGCYYDEWFDVKCDNSSGSPKAFLRRIDLEIHQDIYYSTNSLSVNIRASEYNQLSTKLWEGSPFSISKSRNRLIAIGCDMYAVTKQSNSTIGECVSNCTCDQEHKSGGCYIACSIQNSAPKLHFGNLNASFPKCNSAFIADRTWLESNSLNSKNVLATLEWGTKVGRCLEPFNSDHHHTICIKDEYCLTTLSSGNKDEYFCVCDHPRSHTEVCSGTLMCKTTGNRNCTECPSGYNGDNLMGCTSSRSLSEILNYSQSRSAVIIGCSAGLGVLLLLIGAFWLYKFIERRKAIKLKQKFFKRNGGMLLQQHLSSNEGNIEKIKLFTSKELEKATDKYNVNRILGQGGQGTVYKGMLGEGRVVAVKTSKIVHESKARDFINEVVVLSSINHRNVLQLLGCCLETEVPLLVYEFIPNGNLFQHLHDKNGESFPLTWELRLRIATDVAYALSYLHSFAFVPIYHRDIKSTNILLDERYRAKVSDFGTSRSVMVDQTHLTTQVRGTFGYLDPEYFLSGQFTDKSDVYSFGVVLVELLTGQRPICSMNSREERSLAVYFLCAMKENRLFEILDYQVLKEGGKEEVVAVANLTKRCLNLNGRKRPTMREVSTELAAIRESNGASIFMQKNEEMDYVDDEITINFETSSTLTIGSFIDV